MFKEGTGLSKSVATISDMVEHFGRILHGFRASRVDVGLHTNRQDA